MFEFIIALKYLIPKKRALATSLISLLSIFIISLVVWLILVFLSVTTGIEKNWLKKLTSLNAPLRIVPTDNYYNSYYYLVDKISAESNYTTKTIGEKANSENTISYNELEDMEKPYFWPNVDLDANGEPKDLVKIVYKILANKKPNLAFDDFEISGALMRLSLYRIDPLNTSSYDDEKLSFISQMSYLLSLTPRNPNFNNLLIAPDIDDLNNLLTRLDKSSDNALDETPVVSLKKISKEKLESSLLRFFKNINLISLISNENFKLPLSFIPKNKNFLAYAKIENGKVLKIILPEKENKNENFYERGLLYSSDGENYYFKTKSNIEYKISSNIPIKTISSIIFKAILINDSINQTSKTEDIKFELNSTIQGIKISGITNYKNLKIHDAKVIFKFNSYPEDEPLWPYQIYENGSLIKTIIPKSAENGVIAPKSLKDSGVLIGDTGHFTYITKTVMATEERSIPIQVTGFYDPGILSIGSRCIIVPDLITKTVSGLNSAFSPKDLPSNGIFVWTKSLSNIDQLKAEIINELQKNGIASYWKVESYKDYNFAKDLLEQFQSDRFLFTLIAIIIIIVACSNIISQLILLVNDKKKEIAVMQAMGATKKSIALIFGLCGAFVGLISSVIGSLAAIFTLKHLDTLINLLSSIQGHSAFNVSFFGDKLPNMLSVDALIFILIITPIISLLAGLIPAIKASKLNPSQILRAD